MEKYIEELKKMDARDLQNISFVLCEVANACSVTLRMISKAVDNVIIGVVSWKLCEEIFDYLGHEG